MKRQTIISLLVSSFVCLGLYKTYSYQEQEVKNISRLPLKGEATPDNGNVIISYEKGGMPLVHVAPKAVSRIGGDLVSDDAFSVPVIASAPEPAPIIVEAEETKEAQPASPWDAITQQEINLQMISLIQGQRYAIINGSALKQGDTFTVRVKEGKLISLRVAEVKANGVDLLLESVVRSITLT